jgi:hypothetical protein
VDTPGFNDTFRDDRDILREVTGWLAAAYSQERKITGIIYLHPINQPRMEGSSVLSMTVMQRICGSENFRNVILVSTFWDVVDERTGIQKERELCESPRFWGELQKENPT